MATSSGVKALPSSNVPSRVIPDRRKSIFILQRALYSFVANESVERLLEELKARRKNSSGWESDYRGSLKA